jgi:hypothetical protein
MIDIEINIASLTFDETNEGVKVRMGLDGCRL